MRGIDSFNFPAFHAAAAVLRALGWEVLSPAEHDEEGGFDPSANTLDGFDLNAAMAWDIQAVLDADAVVVLPGWRSSAGVALEVSVARGIGKPIHEYPNLEPVGDEPPTLEAHRLVRGARQAAYGHPVDDFSRTGRMWGAILGIGDVSPEHVGLCMAAVKISREVNGHKNDNLVDLCGYAETVALVHERHALASRWGARMANRLPDSMVIVDDLIRTKKRRGRKRKP
jgi:hypothetical protein